MDFAYFPDIKKGVILLKGSLGINITITYVGDSENIIFAQSDLRIDGIRYKPGKIFQKFENKLFINLD